jgi:sugar phosphate permease
VLTAGAAAGQMVFLPALAAVAQAAGWRAMLGLIATVCFLLVPLVALLMRDRPADIGLAPYGEDGPPLPTRMSTGNLFTTPLKALAEGARNRDFMLLAGSYFICGATTVGLIATHLVPACIDAGIAPLVGASLLAGMGVFNMIGATASGWLSDRIDNRKLLAVYFVARGVSLLYLPFSFTSLEGLSLFAIFYGLDWIATVPPTVRLCTGIFGREKGGMMYGWVSATHQLGGAAAAFLGGVARGDLGGYLEAFIVAGFTCMLAAVMVLLIGRGARVVAMA